MAYGSGPSKGGKGTIKPGQAGVAQIIARGKSKGIKYTPAQARKERDRVIAAQNKKKPKKPKK